MQTQHSAVSKATDITALILKTLIQTAMGLKMAGRLITDGIRLMTIHLKLMKSSDLMIWTNAGDSVEWSMPATNKSFFRVRAQP